MEDIDPYRNFLREGWSSFLPQLHFVRSLKWGNIEIDLKSSAQSGRLKLLSEVELRLSAPSRQVSAKPSDLVVEDEEGPILLREGGPCLGRLKGSPNRWKGSELLNRDGRVAGVERQHHGTVWLPGNIAVGFNGAAAL